MRLILGGINGDYLTNIVLNCAKETHEVWAAVAYATDSALLFDWCRSNDIPLTYYGRLDEDVAVSVQILKQFLAAKSPNFRCRLVQHHHAKVIWWRGHGIYIGSANLTDAAWYRNIEAGCFFLEEELDAISFEAIESLFSTLGSHFTPLTDELVAEMEKRARELNNSSHDGRKFWTNASVVTWSGLVTRTSTRTANEQQRDTFLREWHSTLQELRTIGQLVSDDRYRPAWVSKDAPQGAQADQFLHAHYYQNTFENGRANYEALFEKNRSTPDRALANAMNWWHGLKSAPMQEDLMLNSTAPRLKKLLASTHVENLTYREFREICSDVHAIRDYSRRVPNLKVNLTPVGPKTIDEKIDALSKTIWESQNKNGGQVRSTLQYLLFGGADDQLPIRLWECVSNPKWKIEGLGISALGELVGWALPERFPPRNGRTSKALRSLGFDVRVHVG